jgi:hypothetical protein
MLISRNQNAGQNYDIRTVNKSYENVVELRYFWNTQIKIMFTENLRKNKFGECHCHSIHNVLFSNLPSKKCEQN